LSPDETAVEKLRRKPMSTVVALTLFVGMCCALQWQWFASRMAMTATTTTETPRSAS
jgi:hypothetical protein